MKQLLMYKQLVCEGEGRELSILVGEGGTAGSPWRASPLQVTPPVLRNAGLVSEASICLDGAQGTAVELSQGFAY